MLNFIGRDLEINELNETMRSNRSEFVVIYGRRRVGKTCLVHHFFNKQYAFHYVGSRDRKKKAQLADFAKNLQKYAGLPKRPVLSCWSEAFDALAEYLETLPSEGRKVIFFDEMPWIDHKQSDFVESLEYFWNSWVTMRDDIVFVACGSATSWMVDKLIDNQGGLHNRVTRRINLHPFSLYECEQFLQKGGFQWDKYQILQMYMILGGVPFYLSLLKPHLSLIQNIDVLFFKSGSLLKDEFDELYNALFNNADKYIKIVEALAGKSSGMMRSEIEAKTGISGGQLTKMLTNLERCDFIKGFNRIGNKSKLTLYRLLDFYTLFYFKFIQRNRTMDEDYWMHNFQTHSVEAWEGFTFELVGLCHIAQIKKALGISGISTAISSWRSIPNNSTDKYGTQIDLVISRVDKIVHLCEMKFCENQYVITKDYEEQLRRRAQVFSEETHISRGVVHTLITPVGLNQGAHSGIIHSVVTAKDLFAE